MEVVTVSMYVMPVALSLTMQLMHTVDILGAATTPMGMVPRGSSRATSTSSGVCRQAVTPAKPHGRVGGHMTANACTGEEGLGGVEAFGGEAGGFFPGNFSNIPTCVYRFGWQHKPHLPRHGGVEGAWRLASFIPNSRIHCGSWKEAHTSLASFL